MRVLIIGVVSEIHSDHISAKNTSFYRSVGAKLEVVRQNFSLLASFVITTGASVYYSCQMQLMLGVWGHAPQENFEFLSCEMAF